MALADFTNFINTGVRVIELDQGYRILDTASFNSAYVFGSAQDGEYSPTLCTTVSDFQNQFPGSLSLPYIRNMFLNDPDMEIFFIRVGIANKWIISVENVTPGDASFTVLGETITVTIGASDNAASVADTILSAVNQSIGLAGSVQAYSTANTDEVLLVASSFDTDLNVSNVSTNLAAIEDTATTPGRLDYVTAIQNLFSVDSQPRQGFVIAPEAFERLTTASDRQSVGLAIENLCSTFDFFGILDIGKNLVTVSQILAERALYNSTKGHTEFYGNWIVDLNDQELPPSCYVAALGTLAIRQQGLKKSHAGTDFVLKNAKRPVTDFNDTQSGVFSGSQVNVFRHLEGRGIIASDILTLAVNPNYAQHQGRIIMNVLNGTLRGVPGLYDYVFDPIDAQGIFLMTLGDTIKSILRRLWQQGALFGATETEAFEVVCDFTNNPLDQLNLGYTQAAVYAATVPNARKILVNTIKVPISQVQSVAASGNLIQ